MSETLRDAIIRGLKAPAQNPETAVNVLGSIDRYAEAVDRTVREWAKTAYGVDFDDDESRHYDLALQQQWLCQNCGSAWIDGHQVPWHFATCDSFVTKSST